MKKIFYTVWKFLFVRPWAFLMSKTTIDEKVTEVVNETAERAKAVATELKDVKESIKEVGNQLGDVVDAAEGKKRRGRKPKTKKQ